jgi:ABC-type Na+ efflux pump permease subunit
MTFLPIVARELGVASRRRSTYWVRAGAALAVMVLGTWLFLMMRNESPREVAMALFGILSGSAVLYCLLSGVRSTADCLSEEKREGTLGLLFLTDLKGYDVVIGKLAATSLNALYGVLAVVPMLGIPLLLGGVTLGEFGRMALVAVNTLFFSLAVGLCVSAMSRNAKKAMSFTFLLIFFFSAGIPALAAWYQSSVPGPPSKDYFLPSPGFTYVSAWDVVYKTAARDFWRSLGLVHALGWAFLVMAALIAPRAWQERPAGIKRLRWRERWQLWSYGDVAERVTFRRRLLDQSAFFWLAARARLKPAYVWAVLGLLGCGWVWGFARFRSDWLSDTLYIMTGLILNLLIKGWFASEAGRQLAEDRHQGTMELLLSTPLTVYDVLRGQMLALLRQFLGPVIVVLTAFAIFMVAGSRETMSSEDRIFWVLFWLAAMAMLVGDLVALFWVGLWQALVARNPHRAASVSLTRILVLPWILMGVLSLGVSLAAVRPGPGPDPGPKFFLMMWFFIGLGVDVLFATRARLKLLTQFRLVAAQKYAPRPGLLKRLFSSSASGARDLPSPQ